MMLLFIDDDWVLLYLVGRSTQSSDLSWCMINIQIQTSQPIAVVGIHKASHCYHFFFIFPTVLFIYYFFKSTWKKKCEKIPIQYAPCNTCLEIHCEAHMMIIRSVHLESHPLYDYILRFYFDRSGSHYSIQNMTASSAMPHQHPVTFSILCSISWWGVSLWREEMEFILNILTIEFP